MSYTESERLRAAAWKRSSSTLPDAAKVPAPYIGKDGRPGRAEYDFCLPAGFADHNLLPDVRQPALELFTELGIPWHAGVGDGPSNHLLSSQVQCVNALMAMVTDPRRIQLAFGVGEVLEIEPGRYLTFEYIGPRDYFGEAPKGERIRGAHCTSVDAAFLHHLDDGTTELVLVEWKYTESYGLRKPDPARDAVRLKRYGDALADPNGPVRGDLLPFEAWCDEPFYQLMRQQLLAHALEQDGVADRVRVVHVCASDNAEYYASLARDEHRALGATVTEVWSSVLRATDRFDAVSPTVFLDPEITSREYCARYGEDVMWDLADVCGYFDVTDILAVPDTIDFEGDIELRSDGIEFQLGTDNVTLPFPFTASELHQLVGELERPADGDGNDEAVCDRTRA